MYKFTYNQSHAVIVYEIKSFIYVYLLNTENMTLFSVEGV